MVIFNDLEKLDVELVVDEVYEGGQSGNLSDEVLTKLMRVQNSGGFRFRNVKGKTDKAYIVLYTSSEDINWPDKLDVETGKFKYFGDNKVSGEKIDSKQGNRILEEIFNEKNRDRIPPIFIFAKNPTDNSTRSVKFLGLAVPEDIHLGKDNSLKAIWRTSNGNRFINYEAHFTILNVKSIKKEWLDCLIKGDFLNSVYAPQAWLEYVEHGLTDELILKAPRVKIVRSKEEQLPSSKEDTEFLEFIYNKYRDIPNAFESFAAELVCLLDKRFGKFTVTRAVKDGGMDAIGTYSLGHQNHSISLRCLIEAKCYSINHSIGVKEISRLISRLRNRDFGILVTTSYVANQAYKELVEDSHPVIIVSGKDIVDILKENHVNTRELIINFIEKISKEK